MQPSTDMVFADQSIRFTHEVISARTVAQFSVLRGPWIALAGDSGDSSLCDGYDYCELAASKAFSRHQSVDVLLVREHGNLVALWPFVIERRGPLRIARRPTSGLREEYCRPLVRRGAGDGVWLAIAAALRQLNADAVEIKWVCAGTPLFSALEAVPQTQLQRMLPAGLRGHPGYLISVCDAATFEAFEKDALSPKLRESLRRHRRRLERHGKVEFGCSETKDETVRLIEWIFDQKRAWANARSISNESLDNDRTKAFFCELAARLDLTTHPLVAVTKLNGTPVAASLNTVGLRTLEGGITTYDPAYGECGVGALHLHDLLRWVHARKLDFDFRPVHFDYKQRWATHRTWHETQLVVLTLRGRLLELTHVHTFAKAVRSKLRREWQRRMNETAGKPQKTVQRPTSAEMGERS
ncbi:MAG TPA: GNAT family N-acetyltransferase [Paraburkholderia sp.]|nr:GNAT family N-acetyltransferase [Paraburkholderia sp.]